MSTVNPGPPSPPKHTIAFHLIAWFLLLGLLFAAATTLFIYAFNNR